MQIFDAVLFRAINLGLGRPWLDGIVYAITCLGLGVTVAGISLIMLLIGLVRWNDELKTSGYIGLTSVAASGILSQVGKHIWNRPRPLLTVFDMRWVHEPLFAQSFPSGHTATAFAFATAIGICYPKTRLPLFVSAFIIGITRIYLGAHYPSDVIAGAALGILSGWIAARLFKKGLHNSRQLSTVQE